MTWLWCLGALSLTAQDVSVNAEFEHAWVKLGERTTLKVVVRRPAETVVHIEESGTVFAPFDLVRKEPPHLTHTGNRVLETRRYVVAPFATDSVLTVRIPYSYAGVDGRVRAYTEAGIRFRSVLGAKKNGLRRDYRLAAIEEENHRFWPYVALGALMVVAGAWVLYRPLVEMRNKMRRRKAYRRVAAVVAAAAAASWNDPLQAQKLITELAATWKPWIDEKCRAFSLKEMEAYARRKSEEWHEPASKRNLDAEVPDVNVWVELVALEEQILHALTLPAPERIVRTLQKAQQAFEQRYRFLEQIK
jgi:hypothetical protein